MKYHLQNSLEKKSLEILKSLPGKELNEIVYVYDIQFSEETYLRFGDRIIEIINDINTKDYYGEEYAKLVFTEVDKYNDQSPYEQYFETKKCHGTITSIDIIKDSATWEKDGEVWRHELEDIVVLHTTGDPIILFAWSTVAESVEIYFDEEILRTKLTPENICPINAKDVTYHREIRTIAKLEK